MPVRFWFAIPLCIIISALSALHAYWALGGRWASGNTLPTINDRRTFEPGALATWCVCALLAIAAATIAGKVGWVANAGVPRLFDTGVWGIAAVFLLRSVGNFRTFGFFKRITGTPFAQWDTWLYSPLCLLLAILAASLALAPRDP